MTGARRKLSRCSSSRRPPAHCMACPPGIYILVRLAEHSARRRQPPQPSAAGPVQGSESPPPAGVVHHASGHRPLDIQFTNIKYIVRDRATGKPLEILKGVSGKVRRLLVPALSGHSAVMACTDLNTSRSSVCILAVGCCSIQPSAVAPCGLPASILWCDCVCAGNRSRPAG